MGQVADSVATEEDIMGSRSNGNGVVSIINDTILYQNVSGTDTKTICVERER